VDDVEGKRAAREHRVVERPHVELKSVGGV
jgi:hypothetical protein